MPGIGIDIESVDRFRKHPYEEDKRFYDRIFTEAEIEYCLKKRDPYPHFTGRFAAKEAFIKAADTIEGLNLKDIEIENTKSGKPYLKFKKKIPVDSSKIIISLSHTQSQAVAVVVIND